MRRFRNNFMRGNTREAGNALNNQFGTGDTDPGQKGSGFNIHQFVRGEKDCTSWGWSLLLPKLRPSELAGFRRGCNKQLDESRGRL